MKTQTKFIKSLTIIILGALVLNSCTRKPVDVTNEITGINNIFTEAFNKGDIDALAMNYTDDAKLYPSNSSVIEGREAVKGFWKAAMDMGIKKAVLKTSNAESYGDIAIEEGRYELYVAGDIMVDQGKYIVTWKKVNAQWKIHRDIWNTNNPATQPRASVNDTVWIIMNHVKADKVSQFEDFYANDFVPAAAEYDSQLKYSVRFLKPTVQNNDGTYTYIYMIDPVIKSANYDMRTPLVAKYGEKKANEYLKMFLDCLKNRKQESIVSVQTAW